ncbi:hypothetical protein [Burkholderia sp. NRF60-BP8]|uniref:hypothetical protein n=1 Tax=Burkholderia sp. NRF60-BP8 TaxID=1637853 RepID=UPI00131F1B38|nr:hypothetical protein [Burkholderia sp. NRF60-BP8]
MSNDDLNQVAKQVDHFDGFELVQPGRRQRQQRDQNPAYKIVRVERTNESIEKSKREILARRLVKRAEAFAAFIVIVESKGLPAHVIDETKLSEIAIGERWDMVPLVLAHLIRTDEEVRIAFQEFSRTAKNCANAFVRGAYSVSGKVREAVSAKYRDIFLHAASAYARKLSLLETSLDRLSSISASELRELANTGDELAARVASIGERISEELARRKASSGGRTRAEKYAVVSEEAQRLARDRVPTSGKWPSRAQAVRAILDDVQKCAEANNARLTDTQAPETIDGWLKSMPDAETLFARRYPPSTGKHPPSTG